MTDMEAGSPDAPAIEERMVSLALQCGINLDRTEDPVTFSDVRKAAESDRDLRAGIWWAPQVLPHGLADYLVRSWTIHIETFDRTRSLADLEIAAGWARRHAVAARCLLAIPKPPLVAAQPHKSAAAKEESP